MFPTFVDKNIFTGIISICMTVDDIVNVQEFTKSYIPVCIN